MKTILISVLILTIVPFANAQIRCECEYDDWVDDCDAEFERKGDWILFKSDTQRCSRIDWYTDSQPRLTIVEDGKETENLMGVPPTAEISIASCKVCKDRDFQKDTVPSDSAGQLSRDQLLGIAEAAYRSCAGVIRAVDSKYSTAQESREFVREQSYQEFRRYEARLDERKIASYSDLLRQHNDFLAGVRQRAQKHPNGGFYEDIYGVANCAGQALSQSSP